MRPVWNLQHLLLRLGIEPARASDSLAPARTSRQVPELRAINGGKDLKYTDKQGQPHAGWPQYPITASTD